jgi:hypothetical protein
MKGIAPKLKGIATSKIFIWMVVAVIFLIVIRRLLGPRKAKQISPPADNITGVYTQQQKDQIVSIASEMFKELDGWKLNWIWGRNAAPFQQMAILSDHMFVGVYNYYNKNYGSAGNTLRDQINSELWLKESPSGQAAKLIISRMDKLNLP